MKKIFSILCFLIATITCFGQPIVPRTNSSYTVQDSRFSAALNLFVPRYADTTAANAGTAEGIDSLGAVIFTYSTMTLWVRSGSPKTWVEVGSGSSGSGTVTSVSFTGGLISVANPTTTPAFTVAGTSGGIPYFNSSSTWLSSGALTANALVIGGGAGAAPSTTTTGTGVLTALGVNVGTAGSFVVNGGTLGTPSSGTATNITGLPIVAGTTGTLTIARGGTNLTALGTDGQLLRVNVGATALEYFTPTYVATNIYTSDGTIAGNRLIDLDGNNLQFVSGSNVDILVSPSTAQVDVTADTISLHGAVTIEGTIASNPILSFHGASSGVVTIQPAADAGTYTLTLPTTDGDADQFLQTNGSGVLTWATASGGSSLFPTTGTGTATGDVTGELAGNSLLIEQGDLAFLSILPTVGAEEARLAAWSADETFYSRFHAFLSGGTDATFNIRANLDGGYRSIIEGTANVSTSSITHTSGSHIFNIYNGDGDDAIGLLSLAESYIRAFNPTDDDNISFLKSTADATSSGFELEADFNDGVTASSIVALANTSTATITYTADQHTITGAVRISALGGSGSGFVAVDNDGDLSFSSGSGANTALSNLAAVAINTSLISDADNTDDLGSTANGWKDVYSRTVKLDGSTSGTATLQATATAGTPTITFGTVTGTVAITGDKLSAFAATTSAELAGVISNETGSGLLVFGTAPAMSSITLAAGTATAGTAPLYLTSGTNLTVPVSGAVEFDGITAYTTTTSGRGVAPSTMIARIISGAEFTMQNIATVQPVFPTTADVWTLQGSTTYYFEGFYYFTHGTTSHNVGMSFELAGGASVTSIIYSTLCWTTAPPTQTSAQATTTFVGVANSPVVAAAAVAQESIRFSGYISMNAGGTVTPSITFSADPTGTILAKAGTYITFTPVGSSTFTTVGNVN